jgi:YD repeat-containing protein
MRDESAQSNTLAWQALVPPPITHTNTNDHGRLKTFTTPVGPRTYAYDSLDQITQVDWTNQNAESYQYDANGNRTGTNRTTEANNRVREDESYWYAYDKEGNRIFRASKATSQREILLIRLPKPARLRLTLQPRQLAHSKGGIPVRRNRSADSTNGHRCDSEPWLSNSVSFTTRTSAMVSSKRRCWY